MLAPGELIPAQVSDFIAAQLGLTSDDLLLYAAREETRHEHLADLRRIYGYRSGLLKNAPLVAGSGWGRNDTPTHSDPVSHGIEKWECLIVLESKRYAFWGRRNNRDMMRTTATRPAIRSTVSNQEAARPLKSQKTTRAPEPIQRFFGMTSRVSQPLQAKGFPRPHWVFRNGTVLPQAGHRGDKETILANLSKNQMPAMAS